MCDPFLLDYFRSKSAMVIIKILEIGCHQLIFPTHLISPPSPPSSEGEEAKEMSSISFLSCLAFFSLSAPTSDKFPKDDSCKLVCEKGETRARRSLTVVRGLYKINKVEIGKSGNLPSPPSPFENRKSNENTFGLELHRN